MSEHQTHNAGRDIPFTDDELFSYEFPQPKAGKYLNEIAFPLGGIGTGSISISGRGELIDWEIFNRPNKGYRPANTYFMLHARAADDRPIFRVMEGRLQPPFHSWHHGAQNLAGFGFGPPREFGAGFLRFQNCSFTGHFPFAIINLSDDNLPLAASICAWSPFIPLDDWTSSLPVAIFDITLTNTTDTPVAATVALGLQNIVGYPQVGKSRNEWIDDRNCRGVLMSTEKHQPDSPRFGTMALLTPNRDVTYQLRFAETGWFAQTESLMDRFGKTGHFDGPTEPRLSPDNQPDTAHLGLKADLEPGRSTTRTFVLAWLMPNFEKYWGDDRGATWKTWHGNQWGDAAEIARGTVANILQLHGRSRQFAEAFYSSTLPDYVLDAISSQMTTLRTPTVTRLPDGTLYGWEGCRPNEGCCEGTCTHVWTYAQTVAHLFPQLERGMREMDFTVNLREEDGHMQFRMQLPPGTEADHEFHAAADGQMGNVLRTYREWQLCGDDEWLRQLWPSVKKALEYAWIEWDKDKDGLIEGVHHNTLDIEYHGPETVCGSMYLAALRAAEEMARHLGDDHAADQYRSVFNSGSKLSDEQLFNGEYYYQRLDEGVDAPYQFGPGCICDQVLGQWHARMYGLGDLLDPRNVKSALASVFKYNFRDDFYDHHNPHRVYALNDDKGLLICTWPKGGRPERSLTYAFECMIGFEYQVGAHLIYEGFLREGLSICRAIRNRHDGHRRNPYNEFECGSHYARSMSNYAYLLALSGFRYSAPEKTLYFDPAIRKDDFQCFFSTDSGWGTIRKRQAPHETVVTIEVLEGQLELDAIVIGDNEVQLPDARICSGEQINIDYR